MEPLEFSRDFSTGRYIHRPQCRK